MTAIDEDEARLLRPLVVSLNHEECVVFLGAGVALPQLPSGANLSEHLAAAHDYPFADIDNLMRVTQYIATTASVTTARYAVHDILARAQEGYLAANDRKPPPNYAIIAGLNASVFVTTNYDGFLELALEQADKRPVVEICRWYPELRDDLGNYPSHVPTPDEPIVFHLHGSLKSPTSLLVTEDDYVVFLTMLARYSKDPEESILWHHVYRQLTRKDLLFIGYSLRDWNFRVIFRQILSEYPLAVGGKLRLSIQMQDFEKDMADDNKRRAVDFAMNYFRTSDIRVHWSKAEDFLRKLHTELLPRP